MTLKRLVLILGLLACLLFVFFLGLVLGMLAGEWHAKERRFNRESQLIAPVLAGDPAFEKVEVLMYTGDGSAYLSGEVPTQKDLERLRAEVGRLLGEASVADATYDVWPKDAPSAAVGQAATTSRGASRPGDGEPGAGR